MRTFSFVTVDVFTDRRFGGNPLAVFPDARGMSDADMQSLAAEFNLSETTFVLPPADPANTARVRIFNRTARCRSPAIPMSAPAGCWRGRAAPRRHAALRGDRRSGRGRRSRRTARHHRRAAAAVARRGNAGRAARRLRRPRASDVVVDRAPAGRGLGRQLLRHRRSHRRGADARRARPRPLPRGRQDLHRAGAEPPAALPLCP